MFRLFKKDKIKSNVYLFTDAPDTACFSCKHVVIEKQPILLVTHDEDGSWQFLCGHEHGEEDIMIISLKQATVIDPSINKLNTLPMGMAANRANIDDAWIHYKFDSEE